MRPEVGLMQALRVPLAFNVKGLRALLAQNQLKLGAMADMDARTAALPAVAWASARLRGLGRTGRLLAALAAAALLASVLVLSGAGTLLLLGLLALLAVAGVFLMVGLMTGHLRVADRVAEAELVKTVTDGLDTGLQGRRQPGHRALPQPRPAAPHGPARRPACDARGAVRRRGRNRRKPSSASTAPPSAESSARRGVLRPTRASAKD